MKITYSQTSLDDATRQFRYYLAAVDRPDLARVIGVKGEETAHFAERVR